MSTSTPYSAQAPSPEDVKAMAGTTLLDFGTNWCGHCRATAPLIEAAVAGHPELRHIRIEDGKGRPLGRHFGVKLWPTLVVLSDGEERARVVRPEDVDELKAALAAAG